MLPLAAIIIYFIALGFVYGENSGDDIPSWVYWTSFILIFIGMPWLYIFVVVIDLTSMFIGGLIFQVKWLKRALS